MRSPIVTQESHIKERRYKCLGIITMMDDESFEKVEPVSPPIMKLLKDVYGVKFKNEIHHLISQIFVAFQDMTNIYDMNASTWMGSDFEWTVFAFGLTAEEVDAFEELCDHTHDSANRANAVREYAKTLLAHGTGQD